MKQKYLDIIAEKQGKGYTCRLEKVEEALTLDSAHWNSSFSDVECDVAFEIQYQEQQEINAQLQKFAEGYNDGFAYFVTPNIPLDFVLAYCYVKGYMEGVSSKTRADKEKAAGLRAYWNSLPY